MLEVGGGKSGIYVFMYFHIYTSMNLCSFLEEGRMLEVWGGKSGDHLHQPSLIEHLQGAGRSFHQVPEQVKSLD